MMILLTMIFRFRRTKVSRSSFGKKLIYWNLKYTYNDRSVDLERLFPDDMTNEDIMSELKRVGAYDIILERT